MDWDSQSAIIIDTMVGAEAENVIFKIRLSHIIESAFSNLYLLP